MNIILWIQVFFMILASVVVVTIILWVNAPAWLIYASMPIMALGGGAGINLIINGVPK